MGDRRLLDVRPDRLTIGRRMRILRHRTARWFLPPVRQSIVEPVPEFPRLRLIPTVPSARRNGPTSH
jgi:hypothetical protein